MTAHAVELDRGAGPSRIAELATRLAGRWKLGLRAELTRYGLLRDLTHNFAAPGAKIPLAVRPLADRDLPALFGHAGPESELAERLEVAWRRAFIEKGARGGFVAIDERTATPCYVQWLLSPRDNAFVEKSAAFCRLPTAKRFWKTPTRRLPIVVSASWPRRWRKSPNAPAISVRARC